jgi:hypothetical protein
VVARSPCVGNSIESWRRGVSKKARRPEKRVSPNERLHPMPPEVLNDHSRGQLPEHRIAERRDDHSDDGAGVEPRSARQSGRLDLAEGDDTRLGSERPGCISRLLDCVAGQLQHSTGQRRGSQLARHIAQHQADTAEGKHCGGSREGDEAGGAPEGHRERTSVAEKPGRCPIPRGIRDQAHMDC